MIPKFRAWHKGLKKMFEVRTINFYEDKTHIAVKTGEKQKLKHGFNDILMPLSVCKNVILMQSTGLKDKNDKEIFEGDICNYCMYSGSIRCKFIVNDLADYFINGYTADEHKLCEVIGNIYENPELLRSD